MHFATEVIFEMMWIICFMPTSIMNANTSFLTHLVVIRYSARYNLPLGSLRTVGGLGNYTIWTVIHNRVSWGALILNLTDPIGWNGGKEWKGPDFSLSLYWWVRAELLRNPSLIKEFKFHHSLFFLLKLFYFMCLPSKRGWNSEQIGERECTISCLCLKNPMVIKSDTEIKNTF